MELSKNKISKIINKKLKKPLNDGINYNVNKLNNECRTKHKETISLLTQANMTLKSVERMYASCNIVDGNTLLRSSFEYIMMGMMIQFEDNVYKEFINLSIDDDNGRDSTKIQSIINRFKKYLNKISEPLFKDLNRVEKGKMLNELYDKLCKFTHSSLFVSTITEVKSKDEKEILTYLNFQNYYFVKLLLFTSLKYFTNDDKHYIELDNLAFSILFYYLEMLYKIKDKEHIFEKYNDFLYVNDNIKYFNKQKNEVGKLKEEMISLKEDIDDQKFIDGLKKFLN